MLLKLFFTSLITILSIQAGADSSEQVLKYFDLSVGMVLESQQEQKIEKAQLVETGGSFWEWIYKVDTIPKNEKLEIVWFDGNIQSGGTYQGYVVLQPKDLTGYSGGTYRIPVKSDSAGRMLIRGFSISK